jgi:hypothetical protein
MGMQLHILMCKNLEKRRLPNLPLTIWPLTVDQSCTRLLRLYPLKSRLEVDREGAAVVSVLGL